MTNRSILSGLKMYLPNDIINGSGDPPGYMIYVGGRVEGAIHEIQTRLNYSWLDLPGIPGQDRVRSSIVNDRIVVPAASMILLGFLRRDYFDLKMGMEGNGILALWLVQIDL